MSQGFHTEEGAQEQGVGYISKGSRVSSALLVRPEDDNEFWMNRERQSN